VIGDWLAALRHHLFGGARLPDDLTSLTTLRVFIYLPTGLFLTAAEPSDVALD
jgi:hypothetical protein